MAVHSRRLVLVRHGETYLNRHGRDAHLHTPAGKSEMSLTDQGRRQAEALAVSLAGHRFSAVFCSSAPRCLETLAPFLAAGHFARESVVVHDGLLEIDNDILVLIHHLAGTARGPGCRPPEFGGSRVPPETAEEYAARVLSALDEVLAVPNGDVLVVSHHGTNNTLMAMLSGSPTWEFRHQDNTCVNVACVGADGRRLERVNCTAHLSSGVNAAVAS